MIFLDSNVPMYLVGAAHPNKDRAVRATQLLVRRMERLVTDVEVIQEILHRYVAIQRRDAIQPAIEALYGLVDQVLPVEEPAALEARDLVLRYAWLSARDALHAAVMRRHGIARILTFDDDFRRLPGIQVV
jgi:hypothetical protein